MGSGGELINDSHPVEKSVMDLLSNLDNLVVDFIISLLNSGEEGSDVVNHLVECLLHGLSLIVDLIKTWLGELIDMVFPNSEGSSDLVVWKRNSLVHGLNTPWVLSLHWVVLEHSNLIEEEPVPEDEIGSSGEMSVQSFNFDVRDWSTLDDWDSEALFSSGLGSDLSEDW